MKVRRPLAGEWTVLGGAALGSPESLESLLNDRGVLAMVVRVHLHVGRGYVHLVAVLVDAVVVGLLAIVGTLAAGMPLGAVVGGRVAHEAVLEGLVALLVPLEVANHLLLLDEHAAAALEAVEVLPAAEVLAVRAAALLAAAEAADVARVVDHRLRQARAALRRRSARAQQRLRCTRRHALAEESWNDEIV